MGARPGPCSRVKADLSMLLKLWDSPHLPAKTQACVLERSPSCDGVPTCQSTLSERENRTEVLRFCSVYSLSSAKCTFPSNILYLTLCPLPSQDPPFPLVNIDQAARKGHLHKVLHFCLLLTLLTNFSLDSTSTSLSFLPSLILWTNYVYNHISFLITPKLHFFFLQGCVLFHSLEHMFTRNIKNDRRGKVQKHTDIMALQNISRYPT